MGWIINHPACSSSTTPFFAIHQQSHIFISSLTFFHADFGKELPSRTLWRDPSRNCPSPSSALCPLLYRTEHFSREKKKAKVCREEGRKRGGQQKGQKGKKDAWKQVGSSQQSHKSRMLQANCCNGYIALKAPLHTSSERISSQGCSFEISYYCLAGLFFFLKTIPGPKTLTLSFSSLPFCLVKCPYVFCSKDFLCFLACVSHSQG